MSNFLYLCVQIVEYSAISATWCLAVLHRCSKYATTCGIRSFATTRTSFIVLSWTTANKNPHKRHSFAIPFGCDFPQDSFLDLGHPSHQRIGYHCWYFLPERRTIFYFWLCGTFLLDGMFSNLELKACFYKSCSILQVEAQNWSTSCNFLLCFSRFWDISCIFLDLSSVSEGWKFQCSAPDFQPGWLVAHIELDLDSYPVILSILVLR